MFSERPHGRWADVPAAVRTQQLVVQARPAGLPGTLTPIAAGAIDAVKRTDHAAATALSLHLNQGPHHLSCIRLHDVATDASTITAHCHEPAHLPHGWVLAGPESWREINCESGIIVPDRARPVLRAHMTYRRLTGPADSDPLFAVATDPTQVIGAQAIRNAVVRTCARINLAPNWLHRRLCRYGADVGATGRAQGWLIERRLHLHQLDPTLATYSPRRRDRRIAGTGIGTAG